MYTPAEIGLTYTCVRSYVPVIRVHCLPEQNEFQAVADRVVLRNRNWTCNFALLHIDS